RCGSLRAGQPQFPGRRSSAGSTDPQLKHRAARWAFGSALSISAPRTFHFKTTQRRAMTVLMGPADADAWRVSKGWQRFYTDPLPGCDIAPESEADYPSISAVKKAEGQDWSRVSLKRVADASDNDWATMASLPPARRLDAMNSINSTAWTWQRVAEPSSTCGARTCSTARSPASLTRWISPRWGFRTSRCNWR